MNRINEDKNLAQIPSYKYILLVYFLYMFRQLLKLFLTQELMRWPQFENLFRAELNQHAVFTELVDGKNPMWTNLRKRVVEHVCPTL
jgi:hypothetical protein